MCRKRYAKQGLRALLESPKEVIFNVATGLAVGIKTEISVPLLALPASYTQAGQSEILQDCQEESNPQQWKAPRWLFLGCYVAIDRN